MEAKNFIDPRDGQVYKIKRLSDGNVWMVDNLNYYVQGSFDAKNDQDDWEEYGRFYSYEMAHEAIPPGWSLPTRKEWINLFNSYDGFAKSTFESLVVGGESGFGAILGGMYTNHKSYGLWNGILKASYWSSTPKRFKRDSAYMFVLNPEEGISEFVDLKDFMVSVRCILRNQ